MIAFIHKVNTKIIVLDVLTLILMALWHLNPRLITSIGGHLLWFAVALSLSLVQLFVTLWTAAYQASLSFTISWSLLKLKSVELVIISNDLTRAPSWHGEDPLEKEMAKHSSILAWEIPWTEEPGKLQSMGSQESDMIFWLNHQLKKTLEWFSSFAIGEPTFKTLFWDEKEDWGYTHTHTHTHIHTHTCTYNFSNRVVHLF